MTTRITGLGSNMNYDSWIKELVSVRQDDINTVSASVSTYQTEYKELTIIQSEFKDFLDALETFTDSLSSSDVFNQKAAASSDTTTVSATVTNSLATSDQEVTVGVSQLATSTKAKSAYTVGAEMNSSTLVSNLSSGSVTSGTLSIYVNNTKYSINVTPSETLSTLCSDITAITGVSATVADGKLKIAPTDSSSYNISVGSSSDTSNISNVLALTKDSSTGAYTSSKSIFTTNATTAITNTTFDDSSGNTTSVTAGNFYINGVEFTVDSNTTLTSLCKSISSSKAGVTASWDSNSGKMTVLSSTTGAVNVDIQAGSSNFTDVMGLTSSGSLLSGSQTLGNNAIFTINGTSITSSSNTISSDVSGIQGLSLTLNAKTTSDVKVTIGGDYTSTESALKTFVSTYNTLMTDTDTVTGSAGGLYGETTLKSYRNQIRSAVSKVMSSNSTYKTLASIGITTGAIGQSSKAATNLLYLNTDTLDKALTANSAEVKKLLEGDGSNNGILDNFKTIVSRATKATNGFFAKEEDNINTKIKKLNEKLTKMNDALETYEDDLYSKYNSMDTLISSYEAQLSTFKSYFSTQSSSK